LRRRLASRKYSEKKIETNIEAEIMNIIYYETVEGFPAEKVIEITNDNRNVENTCNEIISVIG